MLYRIFILLMLFLSSCSTPVVKIKDISNENVIQNIFVNKGFGLVYDENLFKKQRDNKKN